MTSSTRLASSITRPHPARVLQQIRAHYAGPQTTLKLMVYSRWSWKVLAIVLRDAHGMFWKLDEVVARHSEAQTGCPVTYTYTRRSARRLLEENGFDVDDLFVDHIFPYHVPDYVQYRYRKTLPFRWLPHPAMRALERRLGWHLCVTAHARRAQRIDPAAGSRSVRWSQASGVRLATKMQRRLAPSRRASKLLRHSN